MKLPPAALAALALAAWVPSVRAQQLPPGHPPLDSVAGKEAAPLPADSPQLLPPGHPRPESAPEPRASEQDLLKQLDAAKGLKEHDKPFEVAAALGKLSYGRTRYQDAADYLAQAAKIAEPLRLFYLEQRAKVLAAKKSVPGPSGCERKADSTLATLGALARARVKAADAPGAAACAREAIEPLREVHSMLANARYLLGDAKGALEARDRQLEAFEGDPEALYARGAMLLDVQGDDPKALARAKADFARLVQENPSSPRARSGKELLRRVEAAQAAGGISKLAQQELKARQAAPSPGAGQVAR